MTRYGIIYKLTSPCGMSYYGQTIRPLERRMQQYLSNAEKSKRRYMILDKIRYYGFDSFKVEEIYTAFSKEELDRMEHELIVTKNTLYPNGMNLKEGGSSYTFVPEVRAKMSAAKKGKAPSNKGKKYSAEWCQKHSETMKSRNYRPSKESNEKRKRFKDTNHFYGKKHTKESLEKMKTKLKGRKVWNRKYISIKLINVSTGETYKIYKDKYDAKLDGFDMRSINRCLSGERPHYKGFYIVEVV